MVRYKELVIDIKGGIASVSINRPQKGNALSDLMVEEMTDFFSRDPSDIGARIAILMGAGAKFFCSGADIGELVSKNSLEQRRGFAKLARLYETVRTSPIISIAAVNGLALGGGCGLAASCDIAIAAVTARFGLPEINLGLAPLIVLLPVMRSIGIKKAFVLAARGHFITAEEAWRIGLISDLVAQETPASEAGKLASELMEKSGVVLRFIKKGLQGAEEFNYSRSYAYLQETITSSMLTEDVKEGIAAFLEKRRPVWKHR
jgi:enoyl-CoA hydratase/carnithine racemase